MVEIALGCMNFGKRTPAAEAVRIIDRAIERGVTVFDTANVYVDGESERIVGKALRSRRSSVRIATKVGNARTAGKPEGLSRDVILRAADASLARLGVDRIDVYYMHAPDRATPIEETLAAMGELRDAGKIVNVGVSNYAAWEIAEMMALAHARGLPRPAISQVMYNLLVRQIEVEYASFVKKHPIHTTVFNPLAGGLLAGKHARGAEPAAGSRFDKNKLYTNRYWSERFFDLVDAYGEVAKEAGLSLVALAYAWLAGRPEVSSILIGPASVEHLDAALDGARKELAQETRDRIDAIHRAYLGTDARYAR